MVGVEGSLIAPDSFWRGGNASQMKQYPQGNMSVGVALAKPGGGGEAQCPRPRTQHVQRREVRKQSTLSVQMNVEDVCRRARRESRVGRAEGGCRARERFQESVLRQEQGGASKKF